MLYAEWLAYCRSLTAHSTPDYAFLSGLLDAMIKEEGIGPHPCPAAALARFCDESDDIEMSTSPGGTPVLPSPPFTADGCYLRTQEVPGPSAGFRYASPLSTLVAFRFCVFLLRSWRSFLESCACMIRLKDV